MFTFTKEMFNKKKFFVQGLTQIIPLHKKHGYLVTFTEEILKVGLSPSKRIYVIYFIDSPLKLMKNTFYFILKALFVLKIFKFLL